MIGVAASFVGQAATQALSEVTGETKASALPSKKTGDEMIVMDFDPREDILVLPVRDDRTVVVDVSDSIVLGLGDKRG